MRHHWYFSHNGKYPKNNKVVQVWRIGSRGSLVEVQGNALNNSEIDNCKMSYIGHMTIHEVIGSHLFKAAGVDINLGWDSK